MKTFLSKGKLSLEAVALYAEAMKYDLVDDLSPDLYAYVQQNETARAQIQALYLEIRDTIPLSVRSSFSEFLRRKHVEDLVVLNSENYQADSLVCSPKPDEICLNTIRFELNTNIIKRPQTVDLLLEHTRQNIRHQYQRRVFPYQCFFRISLPLTQFPLGRYKWSLSLEDGQLEEGDIILSSNEELYAFMQAEEA